MDIQRTGLLVMLGILTYVLFLQWNTYTDNAAELDQPAPAQLNVPARENASDLEIPVTEPDGSVRDVQATQSGETITITTPLLELTIDLTGGDVTQALLADFPTDIDRPNDPIALLDSRDRVYVAQSGLVGQDGPDAFESGRPVYTSAQASYEISDEQTVVLQTTADNGLIIEKHFRIHPDRYDIEVTHRIQNTSSEPRVVTPFVQLKRDNSADPSIQNSMGMQAFLGYALRTADERYRKISFDDFEAASDARELNAELRDAAVDGGYLALLQHYFTTAWVPSADTSHRYTFRQNNEGHNIGSIVSPDLMIQPDQTASSASILYVGPKDQEALEALTPGLELVVDYGWLWFIAQPLFWCLKFIHTYVGNWGVAIILVTVLVKGAFFQLSAAAYRSMAKMRKFTPEISRLRELYGDDKQRMSKEMMDLYKKEKINPLGGCLPIIVQMPVFIALYWVLLESVELRQAPFFLWIQDLSAKDPFFVLPLLMGVSMYVQTSLNPTPPDPMQAKIMKWMPVAFTFFFLWFPAGLVLYWVCNNVLSIAQQWVITRSIEKAQDA